MKRTMPLWSFGLSAVMMACSDYSANYKMSADEESDGAYGYGDTGYYAAPEDSNTDADEGFDDGLGSETESDFMSLRPATTDSYVFVANPDRNTVTRISVPSLAVLTAEVGVEPSLVETSADYSRAVTFNKGSSSVSVIDADTLDVAEVDVRRNLNQMKMNAQGTWTVVYHDVGAEGGGSSSGGAISFNAISIVDLENQVHFEAMAGSYPHDVQFTSDGQMAVVISDDYLSAIDFSSGEPVLRRIAIADDLVNPPRAEEVLLDPQGGYAIVRQYGVNELVLVDFAAETSDAVSMIAVGENPTDMDVSPDGSEAIVVARGSKELWVYDLSDPSLPPTVLALPEDEVFGSLILSPDSSQGLLYSTASQESTMGVWTRTDDEIVVRGLVKPVSNVGVSPTGETAVVFHPRENGDVPSTSQFYNHYALSLVDMSDYFTSAYQLAAEPDSFASTPDGNIGFYTMKDQPYLELLDYRTFVPSEIQLPSNPVHLGTLPDTNTAFVSQEHGLGRISFFNTDEDVLQTITGFELNAAIEQ
jgi:DNA-binding beta-propeller fold protein YncE